MHQYKKRNLKQKKTYAWERCRLGEVVEIKMGQSPSSKNYTNNPNDYILVQGNADIKNGWVSPRVWTTEITKLANKNSLILSVRAPVGDVAKTNYDVVLGRGVASLNGNEFIYQTLIKLKIDGYWERLSSGSTFESINSNDLKDAEIFLPTKQEQTTIGNFFRQIDELITLRQRTYL
ncbi:restriction endonuclease subunit S [Moraxella bovoculi]|uniref:restriction endonuclease subunit S n=1 Tax=Moraxella bovoculi TaxID=386891 RepID=UPI0006247294|nr:restriction endonuclease subunit S [Moraxella bovoculi]